MSDHDRNRLKKVCTELRDARETLMDARKSAKNVTTMVAKEEAARSIKEAKESLTRLEAEHEVLLHKVAVV